MSTFEHAGITYHHGPHSVGFAGNGPAAAAGAIRRIRKRRLARLHVLDICCGCGVMGLTMLKEMGTSIVSSLVLSDVNIFNVESVRMTRPR